MRVKKSLVAVSAIALAGVASALFGLPSRAWAYLLPTEAIIQEIASRRARLGYDTLVAEGKRQTPGSPPIPVRWLVRANDAYRIETTSDTEGSTVSLTTGGPPKIMQVTTMVCPTMAPSAPERSARHRLTRTP